MKKMICLGALLLAGFASQAHAQYYYGATPYNYYARPVFYNADGYLRETTYNTRQFYNLNSAETYLRSGMANTRYFYGL